MLIKSQIVSKAPRPNWLVVKMSGLGFGSSFTIFSLRARESSSSSSLVLSPSLPSLASLFDLTKSKVLITNYWQIQIELNPSSFPHGVLITFSIVGIFSAKNQTMNMSLLCLSVSAAKKSTWFDWDWVVWSSKSKNVIWTKTDTVSSDGSHRPGGGGPHLHTTKSWSNIEVWIRTRMRNSNNIRLAKT